MSPNNGAERPRSARPCAVWQRAGRHGAEQSGADHGPAPDSGVLARRIRRWLPRAAALLVLAVVTTGCDGTLGLRAPLTTQAQLVVTLWRGSWIAAFGVGAVVWGGILWAVIFFRKRGDRLPQQVRYNLPIEILYTVVPFIMVGVLFYFTARDENRIDDLSAHPDVVVDVTGFQWSWEFQYPQYAVKNSANGVTEVGYTWNGQLGARLQRERAPAAGDPRSRVGPVQPDL